jgi:hypothetical protein
MASSSRSAARASSSAAKAPAKARKGLNYAITGAARPSAGSALASYTAAWLGLSGMIDGKAVPRATVTRVAGPTATAYHLKLGNFTATDEGLKLSEKGEAHFALRSKIQIDPEQLKSYETMLSNGQPDGNLVKNAAFIEKLDKGAAK